MPATNCDSDTVPSLLVVKLLNKLDASVVEDESVVDAVASVDAVVVEDEAVELVAPGWWLCICCKKLASSLELMESLPPESFSNNFSRRFDGSFELDTS